MLSESEETAMKEFAFTMVSKILKINLKSCYIQELTMRYEARKLADKFSFVLPINSYRSV